MSLSKFKQSFSLFTAILLLNGSSVFAADNSNAGKYTVKPVAYISCSELPNSIKFSEKPMYCNNTNAKVSFMIKGQNLVGLKKESVKLSPLMINGSDISKDRKGNPTYSLGSFPKVTDDAEYLIFDLEMKKIPFGQLQNAKINGAIDILISEKLAEFSKEVDLDKPYEIKLGSFTLTNKPSSKMGGALMDGLLSSSKDGTINVKVTGNLDSFLSLEVKEGDTKIQQGWSSWTDTTKTINFQKPKQSKVTLHLKYWDNLKQETVKFSF